MPSIARLVLTLGAAVGALAAPTADLPLVAGNVPESRVVPGKWIVSLKPGLATQEVDSHLGLVDQLHKRSLNRRQSAGVERSFGIGGFHAYVGDFDDDLVAEIGAQAEV